ncbi:MAG: hypothetical protein QXQ81_07175 [Candidatus Thorarchaeota archaeon]
MKIPPYWTDPLRDEFDVTVIGCTKSGSDYEIEVDREVARAEGGGQASDRGTLVFDGGSVAVHSVASRNDHEVMLSRDPAPVGISARFLLDMPWRRAMMRNHSGEHLFVSALKTHHSDIEISRLWIDGWHGTIWVRCSGLRFEDVIRAESKVNEWIAQGIESTSEIVEADRLDRSVRARESVVERHSFVRVISFGKHDRTACSGTHVTNTSDIGLFKVVDFRTHDDHAELEFVTGDTAVSFCTRLCNVVLQRRHTHPLEYEQLGPVLDKARNTESKYRQLLDTSEGLLLRSMRAMSVSGASFVTEYLPGFELSRLRGLVKKMPINGPTVVFLFVPSEKPGFLLLTHQVPLSVMDRTQQVLRELGGRGGGTGDIYTGGFPESTDPDRLYAAMTDVLLRALQET